MILHEKAVTLMWFPVASRRGEGESQSTTAEHKREKKNHRVDINVNREPKDVLLVVLWRFEARAVRRLVNLCVALCLQTR